MCGSLFLWRSALHIDGFMTKNYVLLVNSKDSLGLLGMYMGNLVKNGAKVSD